MVNIHILVIYTCKIFWYCFIYYEILRLPFWLKSSLMLHFLAFHWQRRFCENEYIAKIYTKIICNIFFWSVWYSFESNTADFEISIFNLTHKVLPNTSFEIRKSLKRMSSLAYTEMDRTKHRVPSMFAFGCIIWTLLHVFTCTYAGLLISDYTIIGKGNGIPFRWDTPRYWFQFNWSAAYALCILKLRYNQNCPFLVQSHISDFQ